MLIHMMLAHVVRGMSVKVAGTEHVATAGFDVAGGHIEVGFGRLLLGVGGEIDDAGRKRKKRKEKHARSA
jgi:hypothetical protein